MGRVVSTEKDLVRRLQQGDGEAFEELISRYANRVYALAFRYTKNSQDAEEVLQDVFVTVYRKIGGFEGKSAFSSWLFRVTVNSALMKIRKRRPDQEMPIDEALHEIHSLQITGRDCRAEGENLLAQEELRDALQRSVNGLAPEYRTVFILREIDGLTTSEVAQLLQISVPAVKSRLHRARLTIKDELQSLLAVDEPLPLRREVSGG